MALADKYFRDQMKVIRETGFNDKDFKVRAKWEADNAPAHTVKTFGYVTRYDLSKEFPILTLRSQSFKGAVKEVLWIFQKKSTNIKDLGLKIWDAWADENGDLGRTYAYSLREKIQYPEGEFDQVDYLLYQLKNNNPLWTLVPKNERVTCVALFCFRISYKKILSPNSQAVEGEYLYLNGGNG